MAQPEVALQPREKRVRNFNEVSLGYSKKIAVQEAQRCPQCPEKVCIKGCPLGVDIPEFIRLLREGNVTGAFDKIKEKNPLPSICGRICSAPCEITCVLPNEEEPIGIRNLERYVADFGRSRYSRRQQIMGRGKKIAVIGSGPCGLTAALDLVKKGYRVTVFEALDKPGGVLRYGIPEFRIPKKILDGEINEIKAMGVEIKTNFFIGQTTTLEELLKDEFVSVLLTTGAGIPKFMDLPGANLGGVYYGEEFLMRVNLMKTNIFSRHVPSFAIGERIAVIGSGNTALDCARAGIRLGRDVTLIFRRTEEEMRVRKEERGYGRDEGIRFDSLVKPIAILANQDGFVNGIKCIRMDYAEQGMDEKWQLEPVPDSEFIIETDTVIIATGHKPNAIAAIQNSPSLSLNKDGTLKVDPLNTMTSLRGVFAAGNVVTNAGPFIEALAAGKNAAEHIDQYLT